MKLFSYVVTHDTGFAPNPFWGYCTLAACTPNHRGIHPEEGDWIFGTEPARKGSNLVYAMRVSEVLPFDKYYRDPRFAKKKPVKNGTLEQRCGDNIYYTDAAGGWQQHPSLYHNSPQSMEQDLRHPFVFVAKRYYYFGNDAVPIPPPYRSLIWGRQGVKGDHEPDVVKGFVRWLETKYKPGKHGDPREMSEHDRCQARSICAT